MVSCSCRLCKKLDASFEVHRNFSLPHASVEYKNPDEFFPVKDIRDNVELFKRWFAEYMIFQC